VVFRESRVVDDVWAGVAPRALAGEALLIVLDNFEYDVVVASQAAWNGVGAPRNTPVEIIQGPLVVRNPEVRRMSSRGRL
jgi:hypothetical protein